MKEIWCKNIKAFLRYSNFCVGIFYFASPCTLHSVPRRGRRPAIFCFQTSTSQPSPLKLALANLLYWTDQEWCFHDAS